MSNLDRRSVLALGAAAAAAPLALSTKAAAQERYPAGEGTELMPGVRQVDLGEHESLIPGYARVSMRDIVIAPGAEVEPFAMENDMVCHMLEGELELIQNGEPRSVSEGDVWTCAEGTTEGGRNARDRVAIMRITDLHKA
ncbi:MAG TPA: cupin domain-containing protein [Afifellaceae bacterium]|nr:cupin domain-containing protein [Afifellaceae bacterium]